MVRPEYLLPDALEETVAVTLREVADLPLEPAVHRLEVVQVECRYLAGYQAEEVSLRLRPLHPAARRPDGLCRSWPLVLSLLPGISGEGVDEVLAKLLSIREELKVEVDVDIRAEIPLPEKRRHGARLDTETNF